MLPKRKEEEEEKNTQISHLKKETKTEKQFSKSAVCKTEIYCRAESEQNH